MSSHAPQLLRSLWRLMHWVVLAVVAGTNFHTAVPSVILDAVTAGPPLAAEVPPVVHW
jgi:hypothetical protein